MSTRDGVARPSVHQPDLHPAGLEIEEFSKGTGTKRPPCMEMRMPLPPSRGTWRRSARGPGSSPCHGMGLRNAVVAEVLRDDGGVDAELLEAEPDLALHDRPEVDLGDPDVPVRVTFHDPELGEAILVDAEDEALREDHDAVGQPSARH